MSDLRAFIGHSFTDGDSEVVGRFLKYFDQLAGLLPGFAWEHAEAAEPKLLTEKVLKLISDKNVFIGICTRKEQAVPPTALTGLLLRPDCVRAKILLPTRHS